jgi:hypothetical protein
MYVQVKGVVDSTHPDANNYVLKYRTSRRQFIQAISAINHTQGNTIVICLASEGLDDLGQAMSLAEGSTMGSDWALDFKGPIELQKGDEVWAIFSQAATGDLVELKVALEVGR